MKDNVYMMSVKRPLENDVIEIKHLDLEWGDFLWGERSVIVKGVRYEEVLNYKYYPISK
jgi:hypothetical protein